ncbi:50S ribosomal protein L34e [Candidatus Woesearchaeota archaeon]|nr:50S ribosomal protein L34e [Candidatus Woesearchaeota archaeon]
MPRGMQKSRTLRRVFRKTPGSRNVLHYKKRKPSKAHCSSCGAELKGVSRERPYRTNNMSKTEKRPERPYGGVLCSRCTRKTIKENIKKEKT